MRSKVTQSEVNNRTDGMCVLRYWVCKEILEHGLIFHLQDGVNKARATSFNIKRNSEKVTSTRKW
jgi:hypothetical protein